MSEDIERNIPGRPICKTDASGTKRWTLSDRLHREDGPAIEHKNGTKEWWQYGLRHREDGPAIVRHDGTRGWWMDGCMLKLNDTRVVKLLEQEARAAAEAHKASIRRATTLQQDTVITPPRLNVTKRKNRP